jgi:UDP-N-acetylglucosamine pyrophosphorylase
MIETLESGAKENEMRFFPSDVVLARSRTLFFQGKIQKEPKRTGSFPGKKNGSSMKFQAFGCFF